MVGASNPPYLKIEAIPCDRYHTVTPESHRSDYLLINLSMTQQNYGDESDAYGLINPSIYSKYGVYEKDFFQHRTPNEVGSLHNRLFNIALLASSANLELMSKWQTENFLCYKILLYFMFRFTV